MVSLKKQSVQKSKNPYLCGQIRTSGNTGTHFQCVISFTVVSEGEGDTGYRGQYLGRTRTTLVLGNSRRIREHQGITNIKTLQPISRPGDGT